MTLLAWSLAGWCALALAMPRHHEQVFGRAGTVRARRGWRCAGALALALVLAQAVRTEGWAFGVLHAVAALAVAGAAVPALLAWAPRLGAAVAATAIALGAWHAL